MSCGVLSRAPGWGRFWDVRKVILDTKLQPRHTKAAAQRLLSRAAVTPPPSPVRNQLTRDFAREVAAAVEAAVANRARSLVAKNGKPAGGGAPGQAGPDERWPTLDEHQWSY